VPCWQALQLLHHGQSHSALKLLATGSVCPGQNWRNRGLNLCLGNKSWPLRQGEAQVKTAEADPAWWKQHTPPISVTDLVNQHQQTVAATQSMVDKEGPLLMPYKRLMRLDTTVCLKSFTRTALIRLVPLANAAGSVDCLGPSTSLHTCWVMTVGH